MTRRRGPPSSSHTVTSLRSGPTRPGRSRSTLDVMVDDPAAAEPRVLALGARRLPHGDHVYADPASHPFCLIRRPEWAPPIHAAGV